MSVNDESTNRLYCHMFTQNFPHLACTLASSRILHSSVTKPCFTESSPLLRHVQFLHFTR